MKYIADCEPILWDKYVLQQPRAHPLQLSSYGDVRTKIGWSVERPVLLDENNKIIAGFQIITKTLRNGKAMGYIPPAGPYCEKEEDWGNLIQYFITSEKGKLDFIKWEPGLFSQQESKPDFAKWGFQPSQETIQPPRTIIVDLSVSEEVLLSRMKSGTRRSIRISQNSGLVYRAGTKSDARKFGELISDTMKRKGKESFGVDYYNSFYELFVDIGHVTLWLAEFEDDIVAGRMVFPVGDVAYSIWGASSIKHKDKKPNYGLEWLSLEWAKSIGCKFFDFWGVPDYDLEFLESNFRDRRDGLWGVYEFKRGFGGTVVRNAGAFDFHF